MFTDSYARAREAALVLPGGTVEKGKVMLMHVAKECKIVLR